MNHDVLLPPRRGFFFDKWYFDLLADDGSFLFGYFAAITALGRRSAELVVCVARPGEPAVTRSLHLGARAFALDDDRLGLRCDAGELCLRDDTPLVELRLGDLDFVLRYRRRDPPWIPLGSARLWQGQGGSLAWWVPLPGARGGLRGRLGDGPLVIDGQGYADLVQTELWPWQVPLRTLLWGRAVDETTTLIWERLQLAGPHGLETLGVAYLREGDGPGRELPIVAVAQHDWTAAADGPERYPARLEFTLDDSGRERRLVVADTGQLLEAAVGELQSFGSKLKQSLYRRLTGDPRTFKLRSAVQLDDAPSLWAAHEWVLWGRGGHRSAPQAGGGD